MGRSRVKVSLIEIKKTAEMNKGSNGSVNSMPSIWYT